MVITNYKNWKTINNGVMSKCHICNHKNYELDIYYNNDHIDKCCYNCYHKTYRFTTPQPKQQSLF